jgi:tRNA(fMet)-specific endonuclease VapC
VIFDTDFLIACSKGTRALSKSRAAAFLQSAASTDRLFISEVTWMEFVAGFETTAQASAHLQRFDILPFVGRLWWGASRIMRDLGRRGLAIGTPDCMIAATAIAYNQPVVTLNHSHFARVEGLRVITPE